MSKGYGTVPTIEGEEIEVLSGDNSSTPMMNNYDTLDQKQGHICCGCCCDVRRGSIIVDIISIVTLIVDIIALFAISTIDDADDDHIQQALEDLNPLSLTVIFVSEIFLLGGAIWGAIQFSPSLVLVGFIVYAIGGIMSMLSFNFIGIITNLLFAYPHWFLYQEIKTGIMSSSNYYYIEEQSCCCV